MKELITVILLSFCTINLIAQTEYSKHVVGAFSEKSLALGYIASTWEDRIKTYHLLEIEYWHTQYETRHYYALSKYIGSEIGINTDRFLLGPKAGVSLNYGPFIMGAELIYYTDFEDGSLRIAPVFGYGNHIFKLSFSPQLKITNKRFDAINQGQINFAMRIYKIKNEKVF